MSRAERFDLQHTGRREASAIHATPNGVAICIVAIDLVKDVFELAFSDDVASIGELHRLEGTALAHVLDNRQPVRSAKIAEKKQQPLDRTRAWALALSERVGHNKAAVALANMAARRLWAAEHRRQSFDPDRVTAFVASTTH